MSPGRLKEKEEYDYIIGSVRLVVHRLSPLTSRPVVEAPQAVSLRADLQKIPNARILVVEAGPHNKDLENVHMVGGWSQNFDKETDWNLVTPPMKGVDGRQVKLSRGKFLGGSSGVNGTLCIRGSKQDFDDWE